MESWIMGLAGAGALTAAALALTPEGRVKRAVKLVCGLCVVAALLSGAGKMDFGIYSGSMAQYRREGERIISEGEDDRRELEKSYIKQRCEAYILDRAGALGLDCQVTSMSLEWSTEGYWYPTAVTVRCAGDKEAMTRLRDTIAGELGIPADKQTWSEE